MFFFVMTASKVFFTNEKAQHFVPIVKGEMFRNNIRTGFC